LIHGRGTVGSQVFLAGTHTLINNGRISGDLSSGSLSVSPTMLINNGVLEGTNGGTLNIGTLTGGVFTNGTGSFHATAARKLTVVNLAGNLNNPSADGPGSLLRFNGTYTINQPLAVTNRATLNLLGNWTKSANIDASGRIIFDYTGPTIFNTIRSQILSGRN